MKRRQRWKLRDSNLAELRKLKDVLGLEVWQFSDIHYRIIGRNVVDYWPTRGTAWLVGSNEKGRKMSVAEVCTLATDGIINSDLDAEFREIMRQ